MLTVLAQVISRAFAVCGASCDRLSGGTAVLSQGVNNGSDEMRETGIPETLQGAYAAIHLLWVEKYEVGRRSRPTSHLWERYSPKEICCTSRTALNLTPNRCSL